MLMDSRIRNIGVTSDKCKTKSSERSHSNRLLIFGAFSILLIILFVTIINFMFSTMFGHDARNASADVLEKSSLLPRFFRVQPETRVEQEISFPRGKRSLLKSPAGRVIDEDPSFSDQTEFTSQITRIAEDDAFPTLKRRNADTRSELSLEVSRERRDCDLNAKHCEMLLQTVQNYLESLSNQFPATNGGKSLPREILKCLKCKEMNMITNENEDYTLQPKDRYFPHDYVKQNRSSDFGTVVIKLLDDKEAKNGSKRTEVNRTEAAKIQVVETNSVTDNPLQDVTNQSLKNTSISETNTISIDPTNSNRSQWIYINNTDSNNSGINDKQLDSNSAVNDSRVIQNGMPVVSKIDQQHHVINESEDVTSVKPWFTTKSSSTRTQYSAIMGDDEQSRKTTIAAASVETTETSTETRTIIDLTKQITTENVTTNVMPDVIGIDGSTVQPSVRLSFEGHPENQSIAANGSIENYDYEQSLVDHLQTKDNNKLIPVTTESTKSFQQLTATMWTMPHPVCFFGYPDQSSNMLLSPAFYPGSSSTQGRGFPFQNPLHQDSSSPNMQVNTLQFLPRFNYAGSLPQLTGQEGIGPTGLAMGSNAPPVFSLNQQSTTMSQQPIANMPYFCGYMSLPTLPIGFPPIPSTSQSDRSAESKNLPKQSQELFQKNVIMQLDLDHSAFNECPINYHRCDNQYCIPREKWCDGHVDCADVSDETKCSCKDQILQEQLCDGYFDCSHGEDELGCFGCPIDSFSCGDDKCVSISQRCDGTKQCLNGKDELNCNILMEHMNPIDSFTIGYTQGYLHRNIRGQWYPVCSRSLSWATEVCESELGQPLQTRIPEIHTVHTSFSESFLYVSESDNNGTQITSCPGIAIYVVCPPLPCGTRALPRQNFPAFNTTKNNYTSKRHTEKQSTSEIAEFNKLYQETLGLLNASQSEEKVQEQNDTFVGSQSRVVGGRTSQPKAWPFLVAIYRDGRFYCGGVIVSGSHILTAGHCMDGYEEHYYEIHAGLLRQSSFSPMVQTRRIKYVIIHPRFEKQVMQNDIAAIILDRPFIFNRWVRQICLPFLKIVGPGWRKGPPPQSMCVVIGWGAIKESGPDHYLREVEVPILPSCKYLPDQNDATICAGYPEGGYDACQGDSGGPLMCRNPNLESQWYVAGLISHGDGCGRPNEPGAYTKVSAYMEWIGQTLITTYGNDKGEFFIKNKPLHSCPGFSCAVGRCLPKENRCDGIVNCLDAEDEIGCNILKMNARYKDFNNTSVKSQTDEVSSDTTEKNKRNLMDFYVTEMSTEAIPISTSSYFSYQTETQAYDNKNLNTVDIYATTPEVTISNIRLTFTCRSLLQTITINKKCDKHLDCEDGTDEEDCTCRDYLLNLQPTAICDGHLDCDDETDEKDCGICKNHEFHCSRSGGCIPMTKKCDGNFDCSLREDEIDCLALTNGEYINMDSNNRSVLNTEGLLSRYYKETWHVQCLQPNVSENNPVTTTIGGNLCKYLGFTSLQSLDRIVVNKTVLETRFSRRWDNTTGYESSPKHVAASEGGETCTTLRFRCRPVLSSSADSHLIVDPRTGSHTYLWPWLAAIFVDGRYHCSALLLESDWLLSSSSCTEAIKLSVNYTTALLGQSRSFLYVDGPHQQISVIDEIRDVKTTNVSLLHLKNAVNFTRYVQPLFLEKKIYPSATDDLCVAIGTDNEHVTQSIFLQPILQNCDKCYRCFVETLSNKCSANGTSSDWSGTVFCRNEKGWYPAAVFQENDGPCSFRSTRNLMSIDYIHAYLTQALEKMPQPTSEVTCDGVRCNLGQCIPWNQVCNGVTDCRDGADEENKMCLQVQQTRKHEANHKCAKSELRCRNGRCISKSAFCDGKVDCSDGTDEPVICNCAEYLKLTAPERLCDGVRHCFDKTDESPEACQCTEASFKCNTESKNLTCISQDFVCDGDNDCPNGEDETECKKVQQFADNRHAAGEVVQRSYGVWHTLCYPSVVTSQEEATNVCRNSSYTDGIIDHEYQIFNQPVVPSRDDFYMIRLNSGTWITMRNDKPLVTLVRPKKPCYRLFVKCK